MYKVNCLYWNNRIKSGIVMIIAILIFIFLLIVKCAPGWIKLADMKGRAKAYDVEFITENGDVTSITYYYKINGKIYYKTIDRNTIYTTLEKAEEKNTLYYDLNDISNSYIEAQLSVPWELIGMFFVPVLAIIIVVKDLVDTYLKVVNLKWLEKNGELIKKLPYDAITLKTKNDDTVAIKVEYERDGKEYTFISEQIFRNRVVIKYEYVDVLVDPNCLENYHIDFNIEKKEL